MGSPTSFWREHALKNTLNLKNRASLADKATVSVSPKILQLDPWIEMFSAKYCLSGHIKVIPLKLFYYQIFSKLSVINIHDMDI